MSNQKQIPRVLLETLVKFGKCADALEKRETEETWPKFGPRVRQCHEILVRFWQENCEADSELTIADIPESEVVLDYSFEMFLSTLSYLVTFSNGLPDSLEKSRLRFLIGRLSKILDPGDSHRTHL